MKCGLGTSGGLKTRDRAILAESVDL